MKTIEIDYPMQLSNFSFKDRINRKIFFYIVVSTVFFCLDESTLAAKLETWNKDCLGESLSDSDTVAACTTSIRFRSKDYRFLIKRGLSWYVLEDYPYALSDFERALSYSPNNIFAYYSRAAVFLKLGRIDLALNDMFRILERNPVDLFLMTAIARLESTIADSGSDKDMHMVTLKSKEADMVLNQHTTLIASDMKRGYLIAIPASGFSIIAILLIYGVVNRK